MSEVSAEMPRYKCHKEVWALKIALVAAEVGDAARLHFDEAGYAPLWVSSDYVKKHKPKAGGYYVVYKDGYKSFSPAEAFEDGYSLAS